MQNDTTNVIDSCEKNLDPNIDSVSSDKSGLDPDIIANVDCMAMTQDPDKYELDLRFCPWHRQRIQEAKTVTFLSYRTVRCMNICIYSSTGSNTPL